MTEEEKKYEERDYSEQPLTAEQEQEFINSARGLGNYATQQTIAPPAITPPPQGTIAPVTANVIGSPEQVDAKSRKEKIMQDLFSYRQEKPVYDASRPEELKRLANASVIAKGINLIGDNIALANKANVNQKTPDNAERAYLGNMYNYLDDYTRRVDDWNYRDFANKLRTGELALREANSEEENLRRDAAIKTQQKQWQATFDQNVKVYDDAIKRATELGNIAKANQLEIEKKRFENEEKLIKARERYYGRSTGSGTRGTKSDGVIIKTKSGKEYQLSDQDASLIYDDMNRNIDVLQATRKDLFEPGGEYDAATNKPILVLRKGVTEDMLIRAYLELMEEQQAKAQGPKINKNGFEAYYGKNGPAPTKPKQQAPPQPNIDTIKTATGGSDDDPLGLGI